MYWFEDFITGFVCLFFVFVILGAMVGTFDLLQAARARNATFACESRNLESVRKLFSTTVACRARNLGSDTLNVRTFNGR